MNRWWTFPVAGRAASLALAYFALAFWSNSVFGENPAVRLANGLALVFFLRSPLPLWPVLCGTVWIAGALARDLSDTATPMWAGLCNMLEVLVSAAIIRRGAPLASPWYSSAGVPRFLAAWLLVPAASGVAGALLQQPASLQAFLAEWRTWYGASALGLLIATPLLLSWTDARVRDLALLQLRTRSATLLLPGAALCAAALVQEQLPPLMFLTFPVALLMTWRHGLAGATVALLAAGIAGTVTTLGGNGAIVAMTPPDSPLVLRIQMLQLYLVALVVSSLPFAALLAQQASLARALRRSGQARSEFLSAMSHEVRTPMTGMLGMVDLLGAEPLPPHQRKFVEAMRTSGRHLLAVVNDILDFSRIESGRLELEAIDFSLPEHLEQLRSLMHPAAAERGLALDMRIEPHSPPVVHGDPTRLTQVLMNLVSNALKFTRQGGVVLTVRARPLDGNRLEFTFDVADTGIGIAPDKLALLFAPFMQADRSISREFGGSGLGLAISKRLAEAMGGTLVARSTAGEGSVFTLTVPLALGDPTRLVRQEAKDSQPVPPRRILVAEDVEVNRDILRAALGREGHSLAFATNGAEALALLQAQPFDLVLMDVQMPVMDGVEATRRIRKLASPLGRIPVIGLTANVMSSEQARYLGAGMDACLMKPIDWPALRDALRQFGPQGAGAASAPSPVAAVTATATAVVPAPAPAPLVDADQLDPLRAIMSAEEFDATVMQGLDAAATASLRLSQATDADAAAREAHRLAGLSGTLGLRAVYELAKRIETAGKAGRHDAEGIALLPDLLVRTREALGQGAGAK